MPPKAKITTSRQDDLVTFTFAVSMPAEHAEKLSAQWAQTGKEIIFDPRGGQLVLDFLTRVMPLVSDAMRDPRNATMLMEWTLAAQKMMMEAAMRSDIPEHPGFKMFRNFWDFVGNTWGKPR